MAASTNAALAFRDSVPTSGACPASGRSEPRSSSGLRPGLRVSHNLQLVKRLGAGGMGQVWLADHMGLDTQVAVKFISRELAEDPTNVARFEREAKLAARIKSPHVVEVFDYDVTADGLPFIVMENLRGRDLESVLHGGLVLGLADTTRVLVQLCKAMSRAHSLGVVHRDIKAENVFLVEGEAELLVKVLDFGVAKDLGQGPGITISGTTVGTPTYMSPEQLFHPKEIDLRTDLWSTAVLVYRCVTGQFPFEGEGFPSVCLAVAKGDFPSPSTLNRELPAGLDAWFKKAFNKRLRARFQTAEEMADAFVEEIAKAGLLPAAAVPSDSRLNLAPVVIETACISGTPASLCRPTKTSRFWKSGLWKYGAAAAAVAVMAGFGPMPERATVFDWAARAASNGATWALQASNASQAVAAEAGALAAFEKSAVEEVRPEAEEDIRWSALPTSSANAVRDLPRVLHYAPRIENTARRTASPAAENVDARISEVRAEAAPSAPKSGESADNPLDSATIRFGL